MRMMEKPANEEPPAPPTPVSRPDQLGAPGPPPCSARARLLSLYPWIAMTLPLAMFLVVGSFEPSPPGDGSAETPTAGWQLPYSAYPWIYTLKIVLTSAVLAWVWPALRVFPRKVTGWSLIVGIVGVCLWVGLWKLGLDERLLGPLGLGGVGTRSAYNPFEQLKDPPALAYGFMAVRMFGLTVVIALAEELFLRGFLMRFLVRPDWWNLPFGDVNRAALIAGTVVPMLMHPAELLAAAVWFSLVTCLMVKTRSLWDCVVAHGTTNFLLGCYVLWSGDWQLM